jgi:hypothetical protein
MLGAGFGPLSYSHGDAIPLVPTFVPNNYTPVADGGFLPQTIHGHLKGIDNALSAAAGPWSKTLTVIHPTTITDSVAVGATAVVAGEQFRVFGITRLAGTSTLTSGSVAILGYDAAVTTAGAVNGLAIDVFTNVTVGQGQTVNGIQFALPGATQSSAGATNLRVMNVLSAVAITASVAFSTANWTGLNFLNLPTITASHADATVNSRGIQINQPALGGGAGTETSYGIYIVATSASINNAGIVLESASERAYFYRDGTELVIGHGTGGRTRIIDDVNSESLYFMNNAGITQFRTTEIGSKTIASIALNGDHDTGIYWPASDQLGLTAGGNPFVMSDVSFSITAAADTDGASIYWATENGGGGATTTGRNGGLLRLDTGAASAGAAGNNNGGNGGLLSLFGGKGGAGTGSGTGGFGSTLTFTGGDGGPSAGASGTAGGGGNIDLIPGDAGAANGGTPSLDGSVQIDGGKKLVSRSATEIGISVGNDITMTVGSAGSMRAPYLATTGNVYTDAIGGDVAGCFGFNDDTDAGPVYTLELRTDTGVDSWVSVALAGYLIQRQVPYNPDTADRYWTHENQVWQIDDQYFVDETKCVVCGEQMERGDQITMWANISGVRNDDLHCIFGHMHLDQDDDFQSLEQRVRQLELENDQLRARLGMVAT